MASLALTDAFVSIGGVDLSDWVLSVTLPRGVESLDETAMGDTTRKGKGGLKTWNVEVEFKQDFAAGGPDATLDPLVGTTATIIVRPTSAAVSATNPNYTGTGLITNYQPFGNSVGDLATCSVSIESAGTMTRATA
jgi:hypothetical protein